VGARLKSEFNPLAIPNYGAQEAVRYLHIPRSSMNHWLKGSNALLHFPTRNRRVFSFTNLVELYVIKGLYEIHGVKLPAIRNAVEYLLETKESRHPLADYELKTDGRYIFFWQGGEYMNMSLRGQGGLGPILDSYLRRIDRDEQGIARVLHPFLRSKEMEDIREGKEHQKIVSINPRVCFGMPVLAGSRITTSILASRYLGGDSVPVIARSYGRSEAEIESAIKWEIGQTKNAA
jgi:uncharacterized protein (DUF433 family)